MNLQGTLQITTYVGLCVGFVAGVTSQFWKDSVEVAGTTRKRLTPVGWISLAISALGLLTGVTSEKIRHDLQVKEEASQHERQVKDDAIRQKHAEELLAATQPLTSLSLNWKFSSTDPVLWKVMGEGEAKIGENAESSQGGSPRTPFDEEAYTDTLLPLLSYIARIGPPFSQDPPVYEEGGPIDTSSVAVLMPLDDSQNAILSFGEIGPGVSWHPSSEAASLSAGFRNSRLAKPLRSGSSVPEASEELAAVRTKTSSYQISWNLDPSTLANSIDRMNAGVASTAKMPSKLKVAIFYDMRALPFAEGNFGTTYAVNLWSNRSIRDEKVDFSKTIDGFELSLTVNGAKLPAYRLTSIVRRSLSDAYDDEISTRCTILEFERS